MVFMALMGVVDIASLDSRQLYSGRSLESLVPLDDGTLCKHEFYHDLLNPIDQLRTACKAF